MKSSAKKTAALLFFLSLISSTSFGWCTPPPEAKTDNPGVFLETYIDALTLLKSARNRAEVNLKKTENPGEFIAETQYITRDYDCAISYMAPYLKSAAGAGAIGASAEAFTKGTIALRAVIEVLQQKFKKMLDGKIEKPSEAAEHSGTLVVLADDAWHLINLSGTLAFASIIEFDSASKQRISLTSVRRAELATKIEHDIGVKPHEQGALKNVESVASILLDNLINPKRKTHDTPY